MISLVTVVVSGYDCQEYEDSVLWSSVYKIDDASTTYYIWKPNVQCSDQPCFVSKISTYTRALNVDSEENKIGYVRLSNPLKTDCTNPSKSIYEKYMVYTDAYNQEFYYSWECGSPKTESTCEISYQDGYNSDCYTILVYAEDQLLLDIFKVKYTLCKENQEDNLVLSAKPSYYWLVVTILAVILLIILTATTRRRKRR